MSGAGLYSGAGESEGPVTVTIYVGNLDPAANSAQLGALFAPYGNVEKITLITDPETGRARGFGYVEMAAVAAEQAIASLDGVEFLGTVLRVNQARDRGARPPRRAW